MKAEKVRGDNVTKEVGELKSELARVKERFLDHDKIGAVVVA